MHVVVCPSLEIVAEDFFSLISCTFYGGVCT